MPTRPCVGCTRVLYGCTVYYGYYGTPQNDGSRNSFQPPIARPRTGRSDSRLSACADRCGGMHSWPMHAPKQRRSFP